ncbi:MAG: glycosyltransferase [Pseudomonadota bacterium]
MSEPSSAARILIYSHDTFGLGHLRRCRSIAHALVAGRKNLSVLILSGSPIIGSFDFRARVDFVRIPGVIKLRNGEYSSLSLHMDIAEILSLRAEILHHTARAFRPDVVIVDKEPLGLRGEMVETLQMQKDAGAHLVLGLRDVLDDPEALAAEWERKQALPALTELYDALWVYGLPQICQPLAGLPIPDAVQSKMQYTGYLRRTLPETGLAYTTAELAQEPYVLIMTGGGGDGEDLVDWVLRAYEQASDLPHRALVVLGPFMAPASRDSFRRRIEALDKVEALTFDARVEHLIEGALGVVSMGGYNTFCEILSFDKRAVVVPREEPRREQWIRASAAEELGLIRMLPHSRADDTFAMVEALRKLPEQPIPSASMVPGLLDGLTRIEALVAAELDAEVRPLTGTGD